MAYKEPRSIHQFDDVTLSQEKKMLADAVPYKKRQANEFWLRVLRSFCNEKKSFLIWVRALQMSWTTVWSNFMLVFEHVRVKNISQAAMCQLEVQFRVNQLFSTVRSTSVPTTPSIAANSCLMQCWRRIKLTGTTKPVKQKDALSEADKKCLNQYFVDVLITKDTYKLHSFCWFTMARHFGLRGGEVFARVKKNRPGVSPEGGRQALHCSQCRFSHQERQG